MADELPLPESGELHDLIRGSAARAIYKVLYEHRGQPLTMQEIREEIGGDMASHEQLQRRRRDLNPYFVIQQTRTGLETRYELIRRRGTSRTPASGISEKVAAQVLQHGRCAMCGRTPLEDGVKLQIDHKIPKGWGGTDDPENLQPLCEEHNRGKKHFFATYDKYSDRIRAAISHEEVHRRIGELLKAFREEWVPSDLIGIVANAKQYQEDYQKRMRELRVLGWEIKSKREKEGRRWVPYYRLLHWEPWPEGSIRAEIRLRERG
jgi:5-methylcytosine-specific restriction endonuclease McrA